MAGRGPERFVWLVTSPEGKHRIYINRQILERDLPQSARNYPRQLDNPGDKWQYGKKKIFTAEKLKIRYFEERPR